MRKEGAVITSSRGLLVLIGYTRADLRSYNKEITSPMSVERNSFFFNVII